MQPEYVINDDGCWIWQKCRNNRGYGLKWDRETRRLMMAHRWYYEHARGPIPSALATSLCTLAATTSGSADPSIRTAGAG